MNCGAVYGILEMGGMVGMTEWKGLAGAPGCAAGRVLRLETGQLRPAKQTAEGAQAEIGRLRQAQSRYKAQLAEMLAIAGREKGTESAGILEAYLEIASDPVFFEEVEKLIETEDASAAWALNEKREEMALRFARLEDEYLRQRGDDVNNVCRELMGILQGKAAQRMPLPQNDEGWIVVAEDLTPAETMQLDKKLLRGIATERGGATSHTVILAKNLGVPAAVGLKGALMAAKQGEMALLDGDDGRLILSPNTRQMQLFSEKILFSRERGELYKSAEAQPAQTLDGRALRVCVNLGDGAGKGIHAPKHSDGVGLYRTEFLYLNCKHPPGEEEQYQAYLAVLQPLEGRECTIRTLDAGGDKPAPCLGLAKEENPFLGYRAIRVCLDREELFITQLRAILRASAKGKIRLMFPMIATLEELLQAKESLKKAQKQLKEAGEAFDGAMPVGIMVETPAAVLLCDRLASQVDFFSIGTNDLTQYMTAADRKNEQVQYLLDPCNISVLRAVGMVCEAAQRHGISTAICGEAASDPLLIPLWVGLGVGELSVAPALVGRTKYILSRLNYLELQREAQHILASYGEIDKVRQRLAEISQSV